MGQKRKARPSSDTLLTTLSKMLVPEDILVHFEIYGAKESKTSWDIELREKEGFIPSSLGGFDDVVFDGYCRPVEMLSHSFVCKPVYLQLYRRRYKRSCCDQHESNHYDLSLKGVKIVPELGLFLKEED